jgi:protein tyrosine phosphatase (PTP) superfamily phosphohydrolase (DUF442 family)
MADRTYDRRKPPGAANDASTPEEERPPPLRERAMMKRARERGGEQPARIPDGGGRSLPPDVQARMQPHFGADLGRVQVHTGSDSQQAAHDLGARAFTVDQQIHFNRGEFAPGSKEGDRLIAHELTHVAQGQDGRKAEDGAVDTGDSPMEHAADNYADEVTEELHGDGEGGDQEKDQEENKNPAQAEKEEQVVQGVMAAEECDRSTATKIKDELLVGAAEALGVAELLGLRYNVKPYEAQVSNELYRGSRVDGKGMAALKAQGIKSIVSFCMENNDDAKPADMLGLKHLRIPILDNATPNEDQVREFVQFVKDGSNQPAYCHCEAGKGRTGTMVACYRIAVDGWTAEQAIAEGKTYGLQLINQIHFIEKFGEDVASGKFSV